MQRAFPLERHSEPATIVAIDEESLRRYGQWPWPRTRLAELASRIGAMEPAAIAFDAFFPEPDRMSPAALGAALAPLPPQVERALAELPSNDARFAAAIRGLPVVLGIIGGEADPRFPRPPRAAPVAMPASHAFALEEFAGHIGSVPAIDAAARGRGLINTGPTDRVVRSVPLVARVQGVIVPSLGIESLRLAGGDSLLRLADAPSGLARLAVSGATFPMQPNGMAWLRFAPHDARRFVSAADVLAGKADPARFAHRVVLVGIAGAGLQDMKTTPLGETVPGIEIHAQLVENVFDGVSLVRPAWARWAEAAVFLALALSIIAIFPRVSALVGIQLVILAVLLLGAAAAAAFARAGLFIDPAWPILGTVGVYGSVVVGVLSETERQRRQLREQAARVAGEIDAARRIQMGLLPDPREVLAGDRRLSVAAVLEPARSVGGDFYDCFRIDERHLFFAVADVSGKGLPAALFMASAKSQIKSAALGGGAVGEILARAQAAIARENPEHLFVTVLAFVLDLLTGELEYANAGHEAAFARIPRGVPERVAGSGGPPLGVIDGYAYPTGRRTLVAGEWLCLVTDGVTEAMNPNREFFTAERLGASLTWLEDEATPEEIVRRVREDVARFSQGAEPADDITLFAVRWEGG